MYTSYILSLKDFDESIELCNNNPNQDIEHSHYREIPSCPSRWGEGHSTD